MDQGVTRKYGHLPRQVYEMLPDQYEVLKKYVRISPYRVLGEMYGVSHQRIQQVILKERERQSAIADAIGQEKVQLGEDPAGHQPGTFQPWNPHPK